MAIAEISDYRRRSSAAEDLSDAEISAVLDISEAVIDSNICGKLRNIGNYPSEVQEKVKKAIYAQADFILNSFGTELTASSLPESATIGNFSYTLGETEKEIQPTTLNYVARLYLSSAGLLYRGDVDVV